MANLLLSIYSKRCFTFFWATISIKTHLAFRTFTMETETVRWYQLLDLSAGILGFYLPHGFNIPSITYTYIQFQWTNYIKYY